MRKLALIALLVAGCSATITSSATSTVTFEPTATQRATPIVTPAPVVTPRIIYITPEPTIKIVTPAPTIEITLAPIVTGTPWMTFLGHEEGTLTTLSSQLKNMDPTSTTRFRKNLVSIRTTTTDAVAWLDSHPPQPCYQTLWGLERQMYAEFQLVSDLGIQGIDDIDPSLIQQATNEMDNAMAAMQAANDQLKATSCNDPSVAG
jgi:hypothetical protein